MTNGLQSSTYRVAGATGGNMKKISAFGSVEFGMNLGLKHTRLKMIVSLQGVWIRVRPSEQDTI
jgi:hypothetical protein